MPNNEKLTQNLFIDPAEKCIAILGNDYLTNFLVSGTLEKGFSVVSDRRVYFKGKCYKKDRVFYKSIAEERTVDLKDVTGTGYVHWRPIIYTILAIISIVWFLLYIKLIFTQLIRPTKIDGFGIFVALLIGGIPCVLFCYLYYIKKITLFEISFAGGKIAFNVKLFNELEIKDFQVKLRRAKDVVSEQPQMVSKLQTTNPNYSVADEITKLNNLFSDGAITKEEYEKLKSNLMK